MKKYIFYWFFAILCFGVFLYVLIFIPKTEDISKKSKNGITENEIIDMVEDDNFSSDVILIKNVDELYGKYEGDTTRLEITKKIRSIFTEDLFNLKKENINQEYFNKNKTSIKNLYGITEYSELEKLKDYITDYGDKVVDIRILLNTVEVEKDYVKCKVLIIFSDNNEMQFVFKVKKSNISNEPYYIILPNE